MLSSGVKPEAQDRYGGAERRAAALLGQVELAQSFLSKGTDINARECERRTPLVVSASVGLRSFPWLRHHSTVGAVRDGASVGDVG
jgi:hypothetical protein